MFQALKHFLSDLRDHHVLVRTDNTAVVSYINHQGGLRSCPLYRLVYTDPWVVPGQTPLAKSSSHSWASQYGIALLPGVLARVRRDEVSLLLVAPFWPGPNMVLGHDFSPRWLSMGDSRQEGSPLTSGGQSPPPRDVKVVGVAPEGAQLIASGLSTEVVETILQTRAPSTRKLYALKWELSLHGVETASSTQSTAQLVQFWSSCRPESLQG